MQIQKHSRQALLVVGMHRSGTSALSGALAALGACPPKSLMVPTKDNPRGYWESTALMRFNDAVLASGGSAWDDWGRFNPDWFESLVANQYRERLPGVLEQEFDGAPLLLVKDPRICRILPLWLRTLRDMEIEPKFVLPIRHPLEVARSLDTRNQFASQRSQLLWLRHVLDAETSTRGLPRAFVRYSDILGDWRSHLRKLGNDLGIHWPRWSGAVEVEIDELLSAQLRHFAIGAEASIGQTPLGRWVESVWLAANRLIDDPEDQKALMALDDVRSDFNRSSEIFASVVHESEARSAKQLSKRDAALAEMSKKMQEVDEQNNALSAALGESSLRIEKLTSEADRLAEMSKKMQELDEQNNALSSALSESSQRIGKLTSEVDRLAEEVKNREEQIADIVSRNEVAVAEARAAHSAEMNRLLEATRKVEESLQERFREIAKLTEIAMEAEQRIKDYQDASAREKKAAEAAAARAKAKLADLAAKFEMAEREANIHKAAAADLRNHLETLRSSRALRAASFLRRRLNLGAGIQEQPTETTDIEILKQSGLFDEAWYLERYPDVRECGVDPVEHYLQYGAAEKRNPSPQFDTSGYLKEYPDVAASRMNPLLHYLQYGRHEGRLAKSVNA